MTALLEAKNVSVAAGGRTIVQAASLTLHAGELTVLVGPNGAGKTTLVRALAGLAPFNGDIALLGNPLAHTHPRKRARALAYLPQGHVFHWPMSVTAIVALGRTPHADAFADLNDADRAAVARALKLTELENLADRPITTLSGGEKARVAIARALATEAQIILTDEPIASLDPRHQLGVMELLRQAAQNGAAVLAVIHDLALAARFGHRIAVMQDGRIVADDVPSQALTAERIGTVFGVAARRIETPEGAAWLPLKPL